jgi:hypothetical protein
VLTATNASINTMLQASIWNDNPFELCLEVAGLLVNMIEKKYNTICAAHKLNN